MASWRGAARTTGTRAAVCADTVTIARGRPKAASIVGPSRCMKAPASPGSRAIIGEPCETKIEGREVSMRPLDHPLPQAGFNPLARSVHNSGKFRADDDTFADAPRRARHPAAAAALAIGVAARLAPAAARLSCRRAAPPGRRG